MLEADSAALPALLVTPIKLDTSGVAKAPSKARACATAMLQPPQPQTTPNQPRLNLAKRALAQFCPLTGPCPFEISITNDGSAMFDGPIALGEEISGASGTVDAASGAGEASLVPLSPGWSCNASANRGLCIHPDPIALAPGQTRTLAVNVVPRGWATGNVLQNCVRLLQQKQPAGDVKRACATIELDPFNVKMTKTGDQRCAAGGTCKFTLTLFNDGPIPHNAPVTLRDSMGANVPAMPIISIVPPLPCASQPKRLPFECTSPGRVKLEIGDQREFVVTVQMPATGALPSSISNCAQVAPIGGSLGDPSVATGSNVQAVTLASAATGPEAGSRACHEFAAAPVCQGGMAVNSANKCACAQGMAWSGTKCLPPAICPAGWNGDYPNCCPAGSSYQNGSCLKAQAARPVPPKAVVYPPKQVTYPPKTVIYACPASRPVGKYPNCCPAGAQFKNGTCRYSQPKVVAKPPPPKCQGSRPVGQYPNCCPSGTYYSAGACRYPVVKNQPKVYPKTKPGYNGPQPDYSGVAKGVLQALTKPCWNGTRVFLRQNCPPRYETYRYPINPTPTPKPVPNPVSPTPTLTPCKSYEHRGGDGKCYVNNNGVN